LQASVTVAAFSFPSWENRDMKMDDSRWCWRWFSVVTAVVARVAGCRLTEQMRMWADVCLKRHHNQQSIIIIVFPAPDFQLLELPTVHFKLAPANGPLSRWVSFLFQKATQDSGVECPVRHKTSKSLSFLAAHLWQVPAGK